MILCFDIGGSAIKSAHAYAPDDVRPHGRVPTPGTDFDAFTQVLRDAIAAAPVPPQRIAISIAGVLDPETGAARVANIPCLNGRKLHGELQAELGLPVDLANDADCFALAEATVGAGRGHEVVMGVILGTGIGGGVVVRGQLLNRAGFSGEWGHGPVAQRVLGQPEITLPAFPCGCGIAGCLDAVCGARGLEMLHRHLHPGAAGDSPAIIAGWQAGEAQSARTIAIWIELLAAPLAMIQNLLGAGIMPVGGGLSKTTALVAALDQAVRPLILRRIDRPLLVPAECRIEPGLIGAAVLGLANAAAKKPGAGIDPASREN
ncbi:ROK family protein [Paracoccus sp. S1E-3]|uniref:ROK family protein n=1 Tax=Paracoccus sp. S1E-3 TaxID=2756130 RepID=UPI0015EF786B|nr:ROK family protein [Paracoccus sp. S1E-3]MBA4489222.1 ROK family protein [Paracoccus sp. S1E-3]